MPTGGSYLQFRLDNIKHTRYINTVNYFNMGTKERRERERENLRRAILDAARDLFVSEGFDAVSMRRIASVIEYSPTAIYLYFADKDAILEALAEEGFHLLSERLEQQTQHLSDPIERLRLGGRVYLRFAQEQPNYYTIMFELRANALAKHEAQDNPAETAAHRAFGFIVHGVVAAIAQGKIPSGTVQAITEAAMIPGAEEGQSICAHAPEMILAHIYWASLHGAASLLLSGRLGMLPAVAQPYLLDSIVDNTLRGFICPA